MMRRNASRLAQSQGPRFEADRGLINPIMKLKVGCPKIQEYLHVSQYDPLINTSRMCLAMFTLLMPIMRLPDT
jgi:hypothetical protein